MDSSQLKSAISGWTFKIQHTSLCTLYNVILRIARNLLKTSENIKKKLGKFHRLILGLVGLIDAKGIDVAQPIWS